MIIQIDRAWILGLDLGLNCPLFTEWFYFNFNSCFYARCRCILLLTFRSGFNFIFCCSVLSLFEAFLTFAVDAWETPPGIYSKIVSPALEYDLLNSYHFDSTFVQFVDSMPSVSMCEVIKAQFHGGYKSLQSFLFMLDKK